MALTLESTKNQRAKSAKERRKRTVLILAEAPGEELAVGDASFGRVETVMFEAEYVLQVESILSRKKLDDWSDEEM